MSMWKKVQTRAGWTDIAHTSKVWIIWFLLIVVAILSLSLAGVKSLQWPYTIGILIVLRFIAQFIVGPEKKKEGDNDGEEHIQRDQLDGADGKNP